jgi:hypothetical protein
MPGAMGPLVVGRREGRALRRRPIADDLWKRTLVRYPFLRTQADAGAPNCGA